MRYWKVVTGLLVFWLLIIIYMSNTAFPNSGGENVDRTERQLQRALQELDRLKIQNEELHNLATELKDIHLSPAADNENRGVVEMLQKRLEVAKDELKRLSQTTSRTAILPDAISGNCEPSQEHEVRRRKAENDVRELWFFVRSELKHIKGMAAGNNELISKVNAVLADVASYHRTLHNDLDALASVDGQDKWREEESRKLGDLVQRRLHYLQNPKDCKRAKKLVCNLGKGCGFGCQLHHVTYCLIVAYATQRTLILESRGWRYASKGWQTIFQPLSEKCVDRDSGDSRHWGDDKMIKDAHSVDLPIVDSLHPRPDYLPLAIPDDLGDRLIRLHGDPAVWWIGQLVKYLMRPQDHLKRDMENTKERLGFKGPIVGVHIRRTDKVGLEAAFHSVDEYMMYVNEWFDTYEQTHAVDVRRVYLASDDPNVLAEAKKSYPNYVFVSDNEISQSAGLNSRYTDSSLRGVVLDIHFLSLCNFLVCTFSSQVCRVAYELMQTMHGDAAWYFKSLDDIYYFGGQNAHNMEAVESHDASDKSQINLEPGDLVGIAGNHWDGYSKGMNRRNGQTGLYPSYKVQNRVVRVKMPTYPEVKEGR